MIGVGKPFFNGLAVNGSRDVKFEKRGIHLKGVKVLKEQRKRTRSPPLSLPSLARSNKLTVNIMIRICEQESGDMLQGNPLSIFCGTMM